MSEDTIKMCEQSKQILIELVKGLIDEEKITKLASFELMAVKLRDQALNRCINNR